MQRKQRKEKEIIKIVEKKKGKLMRRHKSLTKDLAWMQEKWDSIKEEHAGQYIAIRDSEIIASDTIFRKLKRDLERKKAENFQIMYVPKENERIM